MIPKQKGTSWWQQVYASHRSIPYVKIQEQCHEIDMATPWQIRQDLPWTAKLSQCFLHHSQTGQICGRGTLIGIRQNRCFWYQLPPKIMLFTVTQSAGEVRVWAKIEQKTLSKLTYDDMLTWGWWPKSSRKHCLNLRWYFAWCCRLQHCDLQ